MTDEMDGACSENGGIRNTHKILFENSQDNIPIKRNNYRQRIIFRWIFGNSCFGEQIGFIWLRICTDYAQEVP
jgi:hypothetical protein